MTDKYVVGQVYEDTWGDEVARIVFVDGVWSSDEDRAEYLEQNDELPDNDTPILYETCYCDEFVEGDADIREFVREHGLIDVAERERKDRERQHIVDTLNAMGVDTADLIVSEGRVYIGSEECCDYIQGTHAWCSSSMRC